LRLRPSVRPPRESEEETEEQAAVGDDLPDDGALLLTGVEIRHRSLRAVASLFGRGIALNVMGFGASIVLARLLTPRDFGLVTIGAAIAGFASYIGDGGLGAGLIRGKATPDARDLGNVLGFQLLTMGVITGVIVAVAAAVGGEVAAIAAVIALSLPMSALRLPAVVTLERSLRYEPIARVDLGAALLYYVLAISLALLGAGAWSLAIATLTREIVAGTTLLLLVPEGRVRPHLEWRRIRPLLRFGMQIQAVGLVHAGRDQGGASITAALSGLATVGFSSLLFRLLQIPLTLLTPLWRVSYSAYARLIAAGEDQAAFIERGIGTVIVPLGILCVPLASGALPIVSVLFGPKWEPTARAVPLAAVGCFTSGLVSVTCAGYLFAIGAARSVLWSALAQAGSMLLLIALLVPAHGVAAVGLAVLVGSIVEALILGSASSRRSGARILSPTLGSSVCVVLASVAGARAGREVGAGVPRLLLSTTSGVALFLAAIALLMPRSLRAALIQVRRLRESRRTLGPPSAPV
jgi:O-antigen/teichoic acid export membrane protein